MTKSERASMIVAVRRTLRNSGIRVNSAACWNFAVVEPSPRHADALIVRVDGIGAYDARSAMLDQCVGILRRAGYADETRNAAHGLSVLVRLSAAA